MKSIGPGVQELRIEDFPVSWRIIFRVDPEAIVVVSLFEKRGRKTRKADIDLARKRFREYDRSRSRE
jgi:phage-related protein